MEMDYATLTKLTLDFSIPLPLSQTEIIHDNFNSSSLPNLKSLEISAVEKAENTGIHVANQLNGFYKNLTDLHIRDSQSLRLTGLNFYKFTLLTSLIITNCDIAVLPASVGKLNNLKILNISHNKLTTLPYSIIYCQQLEALDLSHNSFRFLPGYILELSSLKHLRRYDNPLEHEMKKFALTVISILQVPDKTVQEKNIPPLQTLCLPIILHSYPNYWDLSIAPTICRMLDHTAGNIVYCERCYKPGFKTDVYILSLVMFRCFGLNMIPLGHYSCSTYCNDILKEKIREQSDSIRIKWESEYDAMVRSFNPPRSLNHARPRSHQCNIL